MQEKESMIVVEPEPKRFPWNLVIIIAIIAVVLLAALIVLFFIYIIENNNLPPANLTANDSETEQNSNFSVTNLTDINGTPINNTQNKTEPDEKDDGGCVANKTCSYYYDLNQCGSSLNDGCNNSLNCLSCINGTCINGICVANCTPSCAGKPCGDDGCGGSCGACDSGICNSTGQCIEPFANYEGFGSVTRGALDAPEGYEIYHVTNLNDSKMYQNGTLRNGLLYESRIYTLGKGLYIVFDVAGTINLGTNYLITYPYLTIDGSSAPSPGITLDTRIKYPNGTVYSSTDFSIETRASRGPVHDVIINNLRIIGPGTDFSKDLMAIDGTNQSVSNLIIDHCSISAAGDGILDMRGEVSNVTLSWNLITGTELATALTGDVFERTRISMHHNVYADNTERQPKIKSKTTLVDFVNNVCYGWRSKGLQLEPPDNISLANTSLYPSANIIGNYYYYMEGRGVDYWGLKRTNAKNEPCVGLIYFEDNIFPPIEDENYSTSEKLGIPAYAQVTRYDINTLGENVVPYAGTHYPTQEEQNLLNEISSAIK